MGTDTSWAITVDGRAASEGSVSRSFTATERTNAESGGEALEWLLRSGSCWDELDTEETFTVTVAPEKEA